MALGIHERIPEEILPDADQAIVDAEFATLALGLIAEGIGHAALVTGNNAAYAAEETAAHFGGLGHAAPGELPPNQTLTMLLKRIVEVEPTEHVPYNETPEYKAFMLGQFTLPPEINLN
jgi:hypothetical protein